MWKIDTKENGKSEETAKRGKPIWQSLEKTMKGKNKTIIREMSYFESNKI